PAVVQRLARAGEGHARDQSGLESRNNQAMRQAAVIVAGWLEADDHWLAEAGQGVDQAVVFCATVEHGQSTSAHARSRINENFMTVLGDVDAYKRRLRRRKLLRGHGLRSSGVKR